MAVPSISFKKKKYHPELTFISPARIISAGWFKHKRVISVTQRTHQRIPQASLTT